MMMIMMMVNVNEDPEEREGGRDGEVDKERGAENEEV